MPSPLLPLPPPPNNSIRSVHLIEIIDINEMKNDGIACANGCGGDVVAIPVVRFDLPKSNRLASRNKRCNVLNGMIWKSLAIWKCQVLYIVIGDFEGGRHCLHPSASTIECKIRVDV